MLDMAHSCCLFQFKQINVAATAEAHFKGRNFLRMKLSGEPARKRGHEWRKACVM
jgi:hypothetical protein